ncbi:hypothetical protein [Streptomyces hainanensis]|uniref:Uncharacterized protein n=1 Tax=Streptomyces hainanensis TaxID=402648 RepID=A0A4R4TLB6_9ACTN|nr:hypothetical protein [Streptomyces hainanensis]TDC75923.1 hypothetical protein E1283_11035 [Streptomyces hainanensis]
MTITDDLRKTLSNSTPLYVAAGTADLAAQKLRELPATFERLREQAPERLPKLREQAQHAAMQGVGIALEYAVRARETYDVLAERGRTVVDRRRAAGEDEPEVTVERAEQVPVTEPEPVREPAASAEAEPDAEPTAEVPRQRKPGARRTTVKKTPPKD